MIYEPLSDILEAAGFEWDDRAQAYRRSQGGEHEFVKGLAVVVVGELSDDLSDEVRAAWSRQIVREDSVHLSPVGKYREVTDRLVAAGRQVVIG